jgi:tRNA(His) guanylyltransferase
MKSDAFGDRMKGYEKQTTEQVLPRFLPMYARIDGRAFSRFTRDLERPYDALFSRCMINATKALVRDTNARIGYVQSDEISLLWQAEWPAGQPLFGGKVHKLTSVLASYATAAFMEALTHSPQTYSLIERLPHFDCRVLSLPDGNEATNMFLWRAMDARKNAIQMVAQHYYSAKELLGVDQAGQLEMISKAGAKMDDLPTFFQWGTWVRPVTVQRKLTVEELAAIPETHRPKPDELVTRTEVKSFTIAHFNRCTNRNGVIFDGMEPEFP